MSDPLRVVVLADTHLRTGGTDGRVGGQLPEAAWERLRGADVILHAGDILDAGVLDLLGEIAPVHAVLGNNDVSLAGVLPISRVVEVGGLQIGMVHDSGAASGRAARMRRRFPDADVVVFGHSHAPMNEEGDSGQLLFNPGSPTRRRAQPVHTLGELQIADGVLVEHRIIPLETSSLATRRPAPPKGR
jgi:putative phosphoesterase